MNNVAMLSKQVVRMEEPKDHPLLPVEAIARHPTCFAGVEIANREHIQCKTFPTQMFLHYRFLVAFLFLQIVLHKEHYWMSYSRIAQFREIRRTGRYHHSRVVAGINKGEFRAVSKRGPFENRRIVLSNS